MKKKTGFFEGILTFAMLLGVLLTAFPVYEGDKQSKSGSDFAALPTYEGDKQSKSETEFGSLWIINNTSKDMLLFWGELPSIENMAEDVPAGSTNQQDEGDGK